MPKDTTPRTIQRHFPPVTNRCVFKRERLMPRSPLTSHRVFALVEESTAKSQATSFASSQEPLIEKPAGEVGRPGRNGYSLEETLNWGKDLYSTIQKDMRYLAKDYLKTNELLSQQDKGKLAKVFDMAREKHKILEKYKDNWVEMDFLATILKNSTIRSKRIRERQTSQASGSTKNRRFLSGNSSKNGGDENETDLSEPE